MPRKNNNSSAPIIFLLIFAALIVAGCLLWSARQTPPVLTTQSATQSLDLVSDDRIIYGGIPRLQSDADTLTVLKNTAYMVGYSESRRDPLWAAYRVIHMDTPYTLPRPGSFSPDKRTQAQVKEADFRNSGYDKGHMAPNSAIARDFGAIAQQETFLLSNVCPQSKKLNEDVWERLEQDEKKYAQDLEEVWVIDGPIFADLNGGTTNHLASGIFVPTAFFKILIDEQNHPGGPPRVFSVIMPQDVKGNELPQQFLTTLSEIEKETHLEFLWKLDPATRAALESNSYKMW